LKETKSSQVGSLSQINAPAGVTGIDPGMYVRSLNPALADVSMQQEFLLIAGVDQAREAVRQNEFQKVDVIKVSAAENFSRPPNLRPRSRRHTVST